MSVEERAARGAKDQTTPARVSAAAIRAWEVRAEKLETLAMRLIEQATKVPVVKSRANGQQMSARLAAGLKLLDAADKLWNRIGRLSGAPPLRGSPDKAPTLESFRRQRHGNGDGVA
jgi:type VI protein secretion system component VasF